jgi:hypothetical protein
MDEGDLPSGQPIAVLSKISRLVPGALAVHRLVCLGRLRSTPAEPGDQIQQASPRNRDQSVRSQDRRQLAETDPASCTLLELKGWTRHMWPLARSPRCSRRR